MKTIKYVFISIILTGIIFLLGFSRANFIEPHEYYKVYLDKQVIGLVESKEELEEYINNEQTAIKKKYGVDKVYPPNGLKIVKELTYRKNVSSASEIYEKIKEKQPFTIKGWIVNIVSDNSYNSEEGYSEIADLGEILETTKSQTIYVLDKDVATESIYKIIATFVGTENYESYLNDTQSEIKEYGSTIENVIIGEKVLFTEGNVSVNETIYTNKEDLTKFLLYGTLEKQKEYKVKQGDTISTVAYNNTLSIDEFLVANPEISGENALLYDGQVVNIGLIQPQISIITERHTISKQQEKYQTKTEYDSTMVQGYSYVKQQGKNGYNKVTQKIQYVNGKISDVKTEETKELEPTVDKIIVVGSKTVPTVGDVHNWGWAASCYTISSYFGPRWGRMHNGIDIAGCGYGSPIYSINNGLVEETGYDSTMGNFIIINHRNGYYSIYMHLSKILTKKGYTVSRGTKIGLMGSSGRSTGTHLHLGIYNSCTWCFNSNALNPLRFYD